ncbi:MAG TPA: glycosyltransferase [Acidimicrobiia bacterium]|nr:glycosyltransferase [Acidimicrobiia bacterium]
MKRFAGEWRRAGPGAGLSMIWRHLRWRLAGSPPPGPPGVDEWLEAYADLRPETAGETLWVLVDARSWTERAVTRLVRSLMSQRDGEWRLSIAVRGGGRRPWARDPRVGVVEVPDDRDRAEVLERMVADAGDRLLLVSRPCELAPSAVSWFVSTPGDLWYSDHDSVDDRGRHRDAIFKPAWSPRLLLTSDHLGPAIGVARSAFQAVGGVRGGLGRSADHDLALRLDERGVAVCHLPNLLLHEVDRSDPVEAAVVAAALDRRGIDARAVVDEGTPTVVFDPPAVPYEVKVLVPTRDQPDLLPRAVTAVLEAEGVRAHLVVIDNGSRDPGALEYLESLRKRRDVSVERMDEPFNFSRLINRGAGVGPDFPLLLMLNDDVRAHDRRWLGQLAGWLEDPGVAGVGPQMLLPDGRLQHAGIVIGMAGGAGHYMAHQPAGPRPGAFHDRAREVGCLTAACLLLRSADFMAAGGLDESFPLDFQDVDFCLRLRSATGGVLVYDPTYPLTHVEMATRGMEGAWDETTVARFRDRWQDALAAGDPYYSPHLSLGSPDLTYASLPDDPDERLARIQPRCSRI